MRNMELCHSIRNEDGNSHGDLTSSGSGSLLPQHTNSYETSTVSKSSETGAGWTEHGQSFGVKEPKDSSWENIHFFADTTNAHDVWSSSSGQQSDSESEISDVDLSDYHSDSSVESLETRKHNKWLHPFFDMLKDAGTDWTAEQFYCPACRGSGLGETDLYKGFQPLIAHAKHHKKRRVKLHREFAAILEEDLNTCRNMTGLSSGIEAVGLIQDDQVTNPLIVWPPMVVLRSIRLEVDVQAKWRAMGSKELLEMFKDYHPIKAKRLYNSEGHHGLVSLLVFPDSPEGYMRAKLLAKHFKSSQRGRKHWNELVNSMFQTDCHQLLYAYMATNEDMLIFDTIDASKKTVKWGLKRYQDAIIQAMDCMHKSIMEVRQLKAKLEQQQEHNRILEFAIKELSRKLELKEEEVLQTEERDIKQCKYVKENGAYKQGQLLAK